MSTPAFFKNLAWDQWFYGMISSVIGSGATAASAVFSVMIMDPEKFNVGQVGNIVKLSFVIFAVGGLGQFFAYLKQGLPVMTAQTTTEKFEATPGGGTVTTKTTSEIAVPQTPTENTKPGG